MPDPTDKHIDELQEKLAAHFHDIRRRIPATRGAGFEVPYGSDGQGVDWAGVREQLMPVALGRIGSLKGFISFKNELYNHFYDYHGRRDFVRYLPGDVGVRANAMSHAARLLELIQEYYPDG